MAGPTLKHFFQASEQIYKDPKSADLTKRPVPPDGTVLMEPQSDPDEFAAGCFVHQTEPWMIVAFKGTTPNISFQLHEKLGGWITIDWKGVLSGSAPVFNSAHNGLILSQTLVQDAILAGGMGTPRYFTKGLEYVRNIAKIVAQRQERTIYLSGHSLGGAIAEFVAMAPEYNNTPGTCFASPGSTIFTKSNAAITSFIDDNDLIGHFCLHHHVGSMRMIDTAGMALVQDIGWAALQNLLADALLVPLISNLARGPVENYLDLAAVANVLGALTMGISIAIYHMISHYGMVLGFGGKALRTRDVVFAICGAIRGLVMMAYHAGQSAVSAAADAFGRLRQAVTHDAYDMIIGLLGLARSLGQLSIEIIYGEPTICWGALRIPVQLPI
jgi:hypothetical protein